MRHFLKMLFAYSFMLLLGGAVCVGIGLLVRLFAPDAAQPVIWIAFAIWAIIVFKAGKMLREEEEAEKISN